jgi:eukaryotic-like serine/threonine-protein kinase
VARVLDFGVAKAASRSQSTQQGRLKGKLSYMAPEQMGPGEIDRRVDIFTAGIVLWETLTLKRLFKSEDVPNAIAKILNAPIERPSRLNPAVPPALDRVVMKALDRDANRRFQTARDFATAIEEAIAVSTPRQVGEWVSRACGKHLAKRAERIAQIELSSADTASQSDANPVLHLKQTGSSPAYSKDGTTGTENLGSRSHSGGPGSTLGPGEVIPSASIEISTGVFPWTRLPWPLIAGVSVLAIAGIVLGARSLQRPAGGPALETSHVQTVPARAHASPHEGPPPAEPAAAAAPTVPNEPEMAAEPRMPVEASASAPAAEPAHEAGAGSQHRGRKSQAEKTSKLRLTEGRNCNPPYTIDAQGIRRVKPHCL